jgi:hypothetical protein
MRVQRKNSLQTDKTYETERAGWWNLMTRMRIKKFEVAGTFIGKTSIGQMGAMHESLSWG